MRLALITAFATMMPLAASAELTVLSWGGAFSAAQQKVMGQPFAEAKGVKVSFVDSDDPQSVVYTEVQAGNVTTDVASVGQGAASRLCDEGVVEPIEPKSLTSAGSAPASEDFLPGLLGECFVPTDIYSTIIGYNAERLAGTPTSVGDFFDLTKFPGRRGLSRTPQFTLELALMGDGVPADQVYSILATHDGVERALAKLDSIRDQIVWWEAGAQPIQLLADGEVAMAAAYNGRIFQAAEVDKMPLAILWDAQIFEVEGWVIPKGAPNRDLAMEFVSASTTPEVLSAFAEQLPYGPPRRSALPLVGAFAGDGTTPMTPHLPTAAENMGNALAVDAAFWAEHETELRQRFTAWLAAD